MLHAGFDTWSVFRYDAVVAMLKDHETWSSAIIGPGEAAEMEEQPRTMLSSDPPEHTRLRGLVSQAFTPRMVERMEPRIRQIADELLADVPGEGVFDAVAGLSYPLPVIVIAEILGIPAADRDRFKRWSDEIVAVLGTGLGGDARRMAEGPVAEARDYLDWMAGQRRADPRDDLISGLVAAEDGGARLTAAELVQMLILLLVAGNETTTNLIGNALLAFLEHPEALAAVRADPGLLPGTIEEVLRYSSPVQATVRRARHDTELAGQPVRSGQRAIVWLASANRDEAVFAESERFDVRREANRHVAFGLGVHFCLGAPLARLEARVALAAFLDRVAGFERTNAEPLPRVPTFIMRGVTALPLRVRAAAGT